MLQPIQPNTFYRTSIKALVFDENKKILLTKEAKNLWGLPGGGMDWGETPQVCLAREIQEEMCIKVTWIADHPSYFFSEKAYEDIWFTYAIYETKLEHLNFTPSDECVDAKFFTIEEVKNKDIFSSVKIFLELYKPERHL